MRLVSAVLAILLALGCAAVSVFSWSNNGPSFEAAVLFVILLVSSVVVFMGGSPRYLSTSYGILLGVMVAWCEFLFLLSPNGAKSSGTMLGIDQGLAQFLVAMTVP